MSQPDLQLESEKQVLTYLMLKPSTIFDIDGVKITMEDFGTWRSRVVYDGIRSLANEHHDIKNQNPIDRIILEERIASTYKVHYDKNPQAWKDFIQSLLGHSISDRDFVIALKTVLKNATKRKATKRLDAIKDEIQKKNSAEEVVNCMEVETFNFTSNAFKTSDITVLGSDYEDFLAEREEEKNRGTLKIGIETPFTIYNRAIGGGFRDATVNVIAARSKMGKSWIAAHVADHVARQRIPVLYLDTELENNYQSDRRCSQISQVPINALETMSFCGYPDQVKRVEKAIADFQDYPVYYVDIKGWTLDRQISIIRRFFAKHVGKNKYGKYNDALVILDYLKLMNERDKGRNDAHEAIGYRMTILHDLMGEYKKPMLMLAQQNRDGLEKEDESTVSGSDKIIHLCDNFTIFGKLNEADIALHSQQAQQQTHLGTAPIVPNTKLKIVNCRHGPGTKGKSYIATYADIHDPTKKYDEVCGIVRECGIRTE